LKAVLGLKAHSGWAALVVLGFRGDRTEVVERRRIELIEPDAEWAKAPYHAAEELPPEEGRRLVERGIAAAHRQSARALGDVVKELRVRGLEPEACAVLMGAPMPAWSVAEILAVHFRMHKAEGVLFREALAKAAEGAGLEVVPVPEKSLQADAPRALGAPWSAIAKEIDAFKAAVGAPWGKDQKEAALAALIARRGQRR
jgi:hypothetical protein